MDKPLLRELLHLTSLESDGQATVDGVLRTLDADRAELRLADPAHRNAVLLYSAGEPLSEGVWVSRLDADLPGADGSLCVFRKAGRPDFASSEVEALSLSAAFVAAAVRAAAARDEAARARSEAEAAVRSKLNFLSNLSHELRTPLNGILGFSHLLEISPLDAEQKTMVHTIHQSGQRLLATVDNILELAQFEAGQFRLEAAPFSPRAVLDSVSGLYSGQAAEKNLRWEVSFDAGIPRVLDGDPVRLAQAWGHVLSNAVKFTREGSVRVRLEARIPAPEQWELVLLVEDSGIGFSAGQNGQWFMPFHQEDGSLTRKFGGTGLGLALCDRIARAMGGGVSLWAEPGRGTKVRVWTVLGGLPEGESS